MTIHMSSRYGRPVSDVSDPGREQFPHLFHGDPEWEPAVRWSVGHTYEFVEFLDKVLNVDLSQLALPAPRTITFHYTCHSRGIGMKDEAVKMLRQIGNVDFRPLEKTDQCCGFGGTFVTGTVASVSDSGLTVTTDDGSTDVPVGTDTSITGTEAANQAAIAVGLCLTAQGAADDAGGFDATSITVSAKGDDGCSSGFGGMGGSRPDRGGQGDQNGGSNG